MHEYTANFHQHTTSSDGAATHKEVIQAGIRAGIDVMIFTDHNVYVPGREGWHQDTLALMGIEVHNVNDLPEHSHYLCLGVDRDLNHLVDQPQALIDAVNRHGGAGFIAHPFERPAHLFGEGEIPWRHWQVKGYTGLELWNYMSEFKSHLDSKPKAILAAFFPEYFITAPFPETLARWDALTGAGQRVVAIGNSDVHGLTYSMGPLSRTVFPYEYLFKAIRTHLLTEEPLSKDVERAKQQVLDALRRGHCFVANDLVGDSSGFRFAAIEAEAIQGDEIEAGEVKELQAVTPLRAEIRLLKDGVVIAGERGQSLRFHASAPGVYRVECYRAHRGKWRGWIYSNPIYVRG